MPEYFSRFAQIISYMCEFPFSSFQTTEEIFQNDAPEVRESMQD